MNETRSFPKKFVVVFVERMGAFLRHNNILIDVLTTLAPYVFCPRQAAFRAFDKGNTPGLPLQNSKAPAVPEVLCGCVVAKEKPPCALAPAFQFFVLPFPCYHAVCRVYIENFWGNS